MTPETAMGAVPAELLAGLPGIDARWSRTVTAPDSDGVPARWHLLDNAAEPANGTMLCVHGNPTWSYLWRRFLNSAPPGWRVIAVDQLGMGFSERRDGTVQSPRRFASRVADLSSLTDTLGVNGPVVAVGHDWGGPIVSGWALQHLNQVAGLVLANTAVHQPVTSAPPALIRLARSALLLRTVCITTPTFVRGTTALSRPALPRPIRGALAAPYDTPERRVAIGQFVADIPLEPDHPSHAPLAAVADGLRQLAEMPVLLLRGTRDPVFTEVHLQDLRARLPHADVQRYEAASHLVTEDVPEAAEQVWTWVHDRIAERNWSRQARPTFPGATRPTFQRSSVETPMPVEPVETPTPVEPVETPTPVEPVETPMPVEPVGTSFLHPAQLPWAALTARTGDRGIAVVEVESGRRVSFAQLAEQVSDLAAGLRAAGVRPGDRVALLVPPGIDLTTAVYACWRAGAVIVVADAGLGIRSMGRALRGAGPDHVIGIARGLAAVKALRVPGQRIASGPLPAAARTALGCRHTVAELIALGRSQISELVSTSSTDVPEHNPTDVPGPNPTDVPGHNPTDVPGHNPTDVPGHNPTDVPGHNPTDALVDRECAVLFTSGATGPAKGVVYRLSQVRAQLDVIKAGYGLGAGDRLVAAFAPFALYGPALGIGAAVPKMDVTAPGSLTAAALADAVLALDATVIFASPSALRNVVATQAALDADQHGAFGRVRLAMSAGAPIPLSLLREVQLLMPNATVHTPYGMTEAMPVADINLQQREAAGPGNGVCVGQPLAGVSVAISPLSPPGPPHAGPVDPPHAGRACRDQDLTTDSCLTGEICVAAAHVKDHYDQLWVTEQASSRTAGWHRTGDVGHLDDHGRLWIEGRLVHVIQTADGPVTPVGVEQRVEALDSVRAAAAVGVGPAGAQQVIVVVAPSPGRVRSLGRLPVLADSALTHTVRSIAGVPVAAVLVARALPVDIRHQSKVNRTRVAEWAANVMAGGRPGRI